MSSGKRLTATQEILQAGASLGSEDEFSEWDLTVASWRVNPNRFGCRGYEDKYPDHKRVMMEIMAQTKKDNPLRRGWFEKTRPNYYRVTALGMAESELLKSSRSGETTTVKAAEHLYDSLSEYIEHRVFRAHLKDKKEPKTWLGVAAFLGISKNESKHLVSRMQQLETVIDRSRSWIKQNKRDNIRRGPSGGSAAIRNEEIEILASMYEDLKCRFKREFDAILSRA